MGAVRRVRGQRHAALRQSVLPLRERSGIVCLGVKAAPAVTRPFKTFKTSSVLLQKKKFEELFTFIVF